jgi:exodeoxyribonuclease V
MAWTDRQKDALKAVDKWYHEYTTSRKPTKQIFRCFGYAGVGKSTLARHFASNIDGEVSYLAFTGKAALVMRKNGCEGARTIHSAIYIAEENKKTGEITWRINRQSYLNKVSLIIIDECSMVDDDLAKDLLSFGRPILVLGDPGQLPPVKGTGYFTEAEPDVLLTEIHRQAKDNPIIHLATLLRNEQMPKLGTYGESRVMNKLTTSDILEADQVLVGRNVTRESFNKKIRKLKGFDPDTPVVGDRLICLQNDKDLGIFNGGMFDVEQILQQNSAKSQFLMMRLNSQDEDRSPFLTRVHKSFFFDDVPVPNWKILKNSQKFYWSWAITTHKAQGSQWDDVFVMGNESYCFREEKWKWLYTSVTRASSKLILFID